MSVIRDLEERHAALEKEHDALRRENAARVGEILLAQRSRAGVLVLVALGAFVVALLVAARFFPDSPATHYSCRP